MNYFEQFKTYLMTLQKPARNASQRNVGGASSATVKNYLSDLRKFQNWIETKTGEVFNPALVSAEQIEAFKAEMRALSVNSSDRYLSSLRKFYAYLEAEELISTNPFQLQDATSKPQETDSYHLKAFKNSLYEANASEPTIKNYMADIQQFMEWAEEVSLDKHSYIASDNNLFSKLTTELIEEYKMRLHQKAQLSPASINRKLSSIRKYLAFLLNQGIIEAVPFVVNTNEHAFSQPTSEAEVVPQAESVQTAISDDFPNQASPASAKAYSRFGPLRLLQRFMRAGNFIFDLLMILPLVKLIEQAQYLFVKFSGKGVFLATGAKIASTSLASRTALKAINGLEGVIENRARKSEVRGIHHFITRDKKTLADYGFKVANLPKEMYAPISIKHLPLHKKLWHHARYTRPNWYRKYHSYAITHYFHFALLMIMLVALGVGGYNALFTKARQTKTLAAAPTAPPRILSFQGRLTDSSDNPITATTNLRFAIYNDQTATGSALLWQEVKTTTPDSDGIFNVYLGQGTAIPASVFSDNASLYLGITVGTNDTELTPRQQIATVAFASNSETLQGLLPITAGGAGQSNVVLALDSSGNLTIGGSATPTFQASGGQFTLSGTVLRLATTAGSNSDIQLSPDGRGKVDIQKAIYNSTNYSQLPSAAGAVTVDDLFAVNATSSGQSAVTINQDGAGPLISASASGLARFTVDNVGNGSFYGDLEVSGGDITSSNTTGTIFNSNISTLQIGGAATSLTLGASSGTLALRNPSINVGGGSAATIQTTSNTTLTFGGGTTGDIIVAPQNGLAGGSIHPNTNNQVDLGTAALAFRTLYVSNIVGASSGVSGYWQRNNNALAPTNITDDVLLGSTATSSALIKLPGTTNHDAFLNLGTGNLGIGTTTPTSKLHVVTAAAAGNALALTDGTNYTLAAGYQASGVGYFGGATGSQLALYANGAERVRLASNGNVGIGSTSPASVLDVNGTTTGNALVRLVQNTSGADILTASAGASTRFVISNAGNIGIGSTQPTAALDIVRPTTAQLNLTSQGDVAQINLTGDFSAGGAAIDFSNNGAFMGEVGGTADSTQLHFYATSGKNLQLSANGLSSQLFLHNNGNIGIGTSNPSAFKLQVAGNVGPTVTDTYDLGSASLEWNNVYTKSLYLNGSLVNPSGLTNYWQRAAGAVSPANITDDLLLGATATASATVKLPGITNKDALFTLGTGNVGIGTTTTKNKLDVNGNMAIGTYAGVNTAPTNGLIVSGNVGIGTSTTSGGVLSVNGTGTALNLNVTSTSDNYMQFNVSNSVKWLLYPAGTSNNDLRLWDTADRFTFQKGGNLGIGSTSPGAMLDVAQNTSVAADTYLTRGTATWNAGTLSNGARVLYNSYGSLSPTATITDTGVGSQTGILGAYGMYQAVDLGGITLGNNSGSGIPRGNIYGGNVQITGNPTLNDTVGTNGEQLTTAGYNADITSTPTITSAITTTLNYMGGRFTSTITSAGNAGLITNVYGVSVSAGGNLTTTGNTTHYGGSFNASGTADNNYGGYFTASGATNNYGVYSASGSNYFNGSVGIGTTTIGSKLTVVDNTAATYAMNIAQNSATGYGAYLWTNSNSSSVDSLLIQNSASANLLAVKSNGNIGINTYTPTSFKLQVAGDVGPDATNTYNLGSASLQWNNIYANNFYQNGTLVNLANYWQRNNGAISPINITDDLLLGGTATSSAKFAVLNMIGSGTPVASVSAQNVAGQVLSLGGDGTIQGAQMNNITLGGNTTGNIFVNPRNGAAGGRVAPVVDNVTDLGASSSARFRNLFTGGGSVHIQCITTDGCPQNLDYSLGVSSAGTFTLAANSTPLLNLTQGGDLGLGTSQPTAKFSLQQNNPNNLLALKDGNYATSFTVASGGAVLAKPTAFVKVLACTGASCSSESGTFADDTAEASTSAGVLPTAILAAGASTSTFYVGLDKPFSSIYFNISTAGTSVTLVREYWNGSAWATMTANTDNTNNLSNSGTLFFSTLPSDWTANKTINGTSGLYWIRLRSSSTVGTAPNAYSISPTTGDRFTLYAQNGDASTAPTFYINDKGNLGFGTNNPNLGGYGSGTTVTTLLGKNIQGVMEIGSSVADADATAYGDLAFVNGGTTDTEKRLGIIRGATDGSTANNRGGQLQFYVQNNGTSTFTQAMTIRQDGNVGIGSTGPTDKLAVNGNIQASIFKDYENGAYYLDPANATTSLLVAGNVGIGTTGPSAALHVRYASANTSVTTPVLILDNPSGGTQTALQFRINNVAGPTIRADSTNLVLSGAGAGATYLAWDSGSGGVNFGNGASGSVGSMSSTGLFTANTSVNSPIFYDSNNTGFYGDFAGTSNFNSLRINSDTDTGAPLDIGTSTTDYPATSGWAGTFNSSMTITALNTSSIAWHDAGCCVGALSYTSNKFAFDGSQSWGPVNLGINTRSAVSRIDIGKGTANTDQAGGLTVNYGSLGTTAGNYSPITEFSGSNGNTGRLMFNQYRRNTGSTWQGAGFTIGYAVDNSFTNCGQSCIFLGANTGGSGVMTFFTGGAERAFLDASGNFDLPSPGGGDFIDGAWPSNPTGITLCSSGGGSGSIGVCTSDARLKENIQYLSSGFMDKIMQLKPVTYDVKGTDDPVNKDISGFIAQDVLGIIPGAVYTTSQGYYGFRDSTITPWLVGAAQEINRRVVTLETASSSAAVVFTLNKSGTFTLQDNGSEDYTVIASDGTIFDKIIALGQAVIGNLRAGAIDAQKITTQGLALGTENMTIAGQSLKNYILGVVSEANLSGNYTGGSLPELTVQNMKTNLISPLASESAVVVNGRVFIAGKPGDTAPSLEVQGNASISGQLASTTLTTQDATISGTLHAGKIIADDIEGLSAKIATLSATTIINNTNIYQTASDSGQAGMTNYTASSSGQIDPAFQNGIPTLLSSNIQTDYANIASLSGQFAQANNLQAEFGQFNQGLMSLGPTSLSDTSVMGQLSVGGSMILAENTINVLGADLEIQPLKQGGVSFEGGLIAINTDGDLTVGGSALFKRDVKVEGDLMASIIKPIPDQDITIQLASGSAHDSQFVIQNASGAGVLAVDQKGNVTASGSGFFGQVAANIFNIVRGAQADTSVTETVASGSAGTAVIKRFYTERTIYSPYVSDKSLIYVTATSDTMGLTPYIARQTAEDSTTGTKGSFTIQIPTTATKDIKVNWWIVN